jgi:phosphatidylserine synthase
MPKKQKDEKLTFRTLLLIISMLLSLYFLWSIIRLTKTELSNTTTNDIFRGAPNNYSAIISGLLLVYPLFKCKSKWEQILITITATILVCGYIVYLFALI